MSIKHGYPKIWFVSETKVIGANFINYDGYMMVDAVIRNNEIITLFNKVRKSGKRSQTVK